MKTIPAMAIAATLLWATGCATYHESSRAEANRALERTLRAEMTRYGDLAVNAPGVQFHARDGTVTLTGTVPTQKDRDMLDSLVRNTSGVAAINDELRVLTPTGIPGRARIYSEPAPVQSAPVYPVAPPARPGTVVVVPNAYPNPRVLSASSADEWIARHVGEQLALDGVPSRSLQNVTVSVSGENAYVQGVVDSASTRQAIVSSVSRASGVRAVYDQLQVR